MSNWLEASDWKWVQDSVPVACVDVAPLRLDSVGQIERIGLIFRKTPHQGSRWCLVGGRVFRNESLAEAIARQLRETLGESLHFQIRPDIQPLYVSQYFTHDRDVGLLDPRQHSVAMNYCVAVEGEAEARGEALRFEWFEPSRLPPPEQFGFGQDRVLAKCLAAMG